MAIVIPKHEPEVLARGGEKSSTTSLNRIGYNGVFLESRYGRAKEIEEMMKIVDAMSLAILRRQVERIFCDSKACATYEITMKRSADPSFGRAISELAHKALCPPGHNGIFVCHGKETVAIVDPWWDDDFIHVGKDHE